MPKKKPKAKTRRPRKTSRAPASKKPPRRQRKAPAKPPVKLAVVGGRSVPSPARGRPPSTYAWLYDALDALSPGKALRMGETRKGLTRRQIASARQAARRWSRSRGARLRTTTLSGMLFIVRISGEA